jgi:hypothetical protein
LSQGKFIQHFLLRHVFDLQGDDIEGSQLAIDGQLNKARSRIRRSIWSIWCGSAKRASG